MKFATFRIDEKTCYGVVCDQGVQAVSDQLISKSPDLKSAIKAGVMRSVSG